MALSPHIKRAAIGIALLVVLFTACPLIMRVNPGPLPDFSQSRTVYRWRHGRWTALPHLSGGAASLAISPAGEVWTTPASLNGIDRWDGARWTHFKGSDFGAVRDLLPGGFAIQGDEVWAAAREGVARFDGRRWRLYPEGVVSRRASAMAAGPTGVWIVDEYGNLSHFDGQRWTIEDLKNTPAGADWKRRIEDNWLELRETADGAVWLVFDGLWRNGGAGWREIKLDGADYYSTVIGQDGASLWLRGRSHIFELKPDGGKGRDFDLQQLPITRGTWVFRLEAGGGKYWLATAKDLIEFDGSHWRRYAIPPGTRLLTALALGPDGTPWVVAETRSLWRIALWVAPPLGACALALLIIGALLVLLAKGFAESRLAREQAAGAAAAGDLAARQAEIRRQSRALWWQVPLFLVGFPFLVEAVRLGHEHLWDAWPGLPQWVSWAAVLAPVVAIGALLARLWFRKRARLGWMPGGWIWVVLLAAVLGFVLPRLSVPHRLVTAIFVLVWCAFLLPFLWRRRDLLAARLTIKLAYSGEYDRALRRLRWASLGGRTPYMLYLEGWIQYLAGRGAEAEWCLRAALDKDKTGRPRWRGPLQACLGSVLLDLGRDEEARACLESALAADPRRCYGATGMAELLLRQGKEPEKALALVEQAMKVDASPAAQSENAATKAWALAVLGRQPEMDEAIAAALRTLDAAPKVVAASVHGQIGRALVAAQRVPEAIRHFQMACQADPDGQHGAEARQELSKLTAEGA
jgi:tetratricopeptide (TPR) repeat protein